MPPSPPVLSVVERLATLEAEVRHLSESVARLVDQLEGRRSVGDALVELASGRLGLVLMLAAAAAAGVSPALLASASG